MRFKAYPQPLPEGKGAFDFCLRRLSSRKATGKATGRRAKLGNGRVSGNLGIVGYSLPPSHLGYSSILDSTRFGVGSSKLDSALAAPLIPATEPSFRPPSPHPGLRAGICTE